MPLKRLFPYVVLVLAAKVLLVRAAVFGSWGLLPFLTAELCFVLFIAALPEGGTSETRARNFLIVDAALSLLLLAVVVFHAYFGRVPSIQALGWAGRLTGVTGSLVRLFKPVDLLLFVDLPIIWFVGRTVPGSREALLGSRVRRVLLGVCALVLAANVAVGVALPAGGLTASSYRYGLLSAQVIDAISNRVRRVDVPVDLGDPAAVQARIDELTGYPTVPVRSEPAGEARGRNVIVVLVESLQGFAVGARVDGQAVTPNIDRLVAEGLYAPHAYAQVAAGNTADAEFMLNTSLYPLEQLPLSETRGDRLFPSLPRVLNDAGYETMTFHANDLTFWNRDELYPSLGFGAAYAKDFFSDGDLIGMGTSDELMFAETLAKLVEVSKSGKPSYASIVTLTSHHPFTIPKERQHLTLPADLQGTLVGDYLVAENYSDYALGTFIEGLKAAGLYEDSVIVVVGDHFGLQQAQMSPADMAAAEKVLGREYNDADRMGIPLVVAAPGAVEPRVIDRPCGQVDVMPTVLAMLGIPIEGQVHFGRDILDDAPVLLGERYYLPTGSHITGENLVIVRLDGTMESYDSRTRVPDPKLPSGAKDTAARVTELQQLSDAYIDSLPKR